MKKWKTIVQLIVLWLTGLTVCLIVVLTPVKYFHINEGTTTIVTPEMVMEMGHGSDWVVKYCVPKKDWDYVLTWSLVTLILGGLIIYSLKGNKI